MMVTWISRWLEDSDTLGLWEKHFGRSANVCYKRVAVQIVSDIGAQPGFI